jgi:hypothetical protein
MHEFGEQISQCDQGRVRAAVRMRTEIPPPGFGISSGFSAGGIPFSLGNPEALPKPPRKNRGKNNKPSRRQVGWLNDSNSFRVIRA